MTLTRVASQDISRAADATETLAGLLARMGRAGWFACSVKALDAGSLPGQSMAYKAGRIGGQR